jgi:hypothetical protein
MTELMVLNAMFVLRKITNYFYGMTQICKELQEALRE